MQATEQSGNQEPQYLRRVQAAAFLKGRGYPVSLATLNAYAVTGHGPAFKKYGRIALYTESDLISWVQSRTSKSVKSTSELAA